MIARSILTLDLDIICIELIIGTDVTNIITKQKWVPQALLKLY